MWAAFRWRDALDILLVAALIYRVLTLFRGTRAVQITIGLGVLAGAAMGARALELTSLGWLLDHFWSFWVVALIVVFQPELRRALAWIGQGWVLQRLIGDSAQGARVANEVVRATESLASRRIGALIVLERATGLRQYAELGVALDALVSADLLMSVFLPYSPLHDGAVFIQGERVVAAGCFLPLSRNTQIGRALGTRHRARRLGGDRTPVPRRRRPDRGRRGCRRAPAASGRADGPECRHRTRQRGVRCPAAPVGTPARRRRRRLGWLVAALDAARARP